MLNLQRFYVEFLLLTLKIFRVHSDVYSGIGLVLTEEDPYTGVDLDNCVNRKTGKVKPWAQEIIDYFDSYTEISPSGKRAIFEARGDIFTVPAENGFTVNLTKTQGVREMSPSWSPDGKYISYLSDVTGEYEIYLLENKEGAKPKQLTVFSQGSGASRQQH